jgi:organic radical activating enzyme
MQYKIAEVFLFDTCTHKCAYCHFAETGKVLDSSQLKPYRDPTFIDLIVNFFSKRTSDGQKWLLMLTGGEPLLMPNLPRFVNGIGRNGNKAAFYTALLLGEKHPSFRYLMHDGVPFTDYLMVSFHPEAEAIEDQFFERVRLLKEAGHSVILRFIAHPDRINRLEELSDKCRALDIAFHPTPLFSPHYPRAYSIEERETLYRYISSFSQLIQFENGVDTTHTKCSAGSQLISIDMRTGDIKPCASVSKPNLGNIYDDELNLFDDVIPCPMAGISCICDIHFQQAIVRGADDSEFFIREKQGFVEPVDAVSLREQLDGNQLQFSESLPGIGQTATARFLALDKETVKQAYNANREFFTGGYAEGNHSEFMSRQFISTQPLTRFMGDESEAEEL